MPRRLIAFVVALVLACSGFSAVARVLLPAFGDEQAAVQLISAGHHHHDGGLGASDSEGPAQHVECDDGVSDSALLVPAWPAPGNPLHQPTPAERPDPAMPAPFLEGPLRPPRG
jgi:hypothetical protein